MSKVSQLNRRLCRVHGSRRKAAVGRLLIASAAAVVAGPKVRAAVYVFDPGDSVQTPQPAPSASSDGSGNFDPTTADFFNLSSGLLGAFGNTSADTALFGSGGTGGTVTVGSVNAGVLQFNAVSGSYVLNGGTINLDGGTTAGVISLNAASGSLTPTISSVLAGASGLLVQGNNVQNSSQGLSVVTLGGTNAYTGVTNISGGVAVSVSNLTSGGNFGGTSGIVLNGTVGTLPTTAGIAISTANLANEGAQLIYTGTGTASTSASMGLTLGGTILDTINVSNAAAVLNYAGPVTVVTTGTSTVSPGGIFSKQGAGTLGFTNAANAFNYLYVNSGTVNLGTGTGAAQAVTINNVPNGNNLIVGYYNLTPAGASPTNPNVATLNILAGSTVTDTGQGASLGSSNLSSSSTAPNNQLDVLNVAGTLTNNGTFSDFSGALGTGDIAVINITTGGVINATNVKFNTAMLTGTSTNTGTTFLNVSGGTFNFTAPTGSTSDSLVRQAGGPVYVNLTAGQINVGGTVDITNTAAFNASVAAVSTINQSGGTFGIAGNLGFSTGVGIYNLSGGTLVVNSVTTGGTPAAGSGFIFNGGTLQANASSGTFFAVPTGTGLLGAQVGAGGGTINTQAFNDTIAQNFSSGITGGTDGGLTKIGAGTLTLSGASTYTGTTTVAGGTLAVTGSLLTTGLVAVNTGTLNGTGSVGTVNISSGTILANGNGSTGTLTLNALTFLGASTDNVRLAGTPSSLTTPGQIVTNALTAPTAGTVTLNVTGSFANPGNYDLIQFGTLPGGLSGFTLGTVTGLTSARATDTLAVVGNDIVLSVGLPVDRFTGIHGTDFSTTVGAQNFQSVSTGTATDFVNGDAVVFDDTATATSTALNLGTAVSPASTTFNNSSLAYSISSTGGFGIGGSGLLIKNGTAALTVNTTNTYTGGTILNAGTLTLNAAGAAGTGGATLAAGTLNIGNATALANGATLTVQGGTLDNTSGGPLTLGGSALAINGNFTFAGTNALNTGAGAVSLSNNPTVTVAANTLTVPVGITGASSLTVNGGTGGALTLAGLSSFTGGTTVNGGTLNLANGGGTGAIRGALTVNTGGTVNVNFQDAIGYNANVAVSTLTLNGGTFNFNISPTAATPNTTGNAGLITNVVLNGGHVTGAAGAAGIPGQFNFNAGFGITTVASSTSSNFSAGVQLRSATPLSINVASGSVPNSGPDLEIDGQIVQYPGVVGAISKLGTGTLTITDAFGASTLGVSNYSGGTIVNQGALRANDVLVANGGTATPVLGTGTTNVLAGGTLGGNGVTGGPVVVAGTITAGATNASTGTLTTGTQAWNSSGQYVAKVFDASNTSTGTAGNDRLVMSGLTITSGFAINISSGTVSSLSSGTVLVLADDTEAATTNPFNTSSGAAPAGLVLEVNGSTTTATNDNLILATQLDSLGKGGFDLILESGTAAAPEPTSLLLLGIAGAPLVLGRRRATRGTARAI